MLSAFVTPGSPLKSSCASYPAQADAFFYAQGKNSKQDCAQFRYDQHTRQQQTKNTEARLAQSKKIPVRKFDLDAMLHFER